MKLFPQGKNADKAWIAAVLTILFGILVGCIVFAAITFVQLQNQPIIGKGIADPNETFMCFGRHYPQPCTYSEFIPNFVGGILFNLFFAWWVLAIAGIILFFILPHAYTILLNKFKGKTSRVAIFLAGCLLASAIMSSILYLLIHRNF